MAAAGTVAFSTGAAILLFMSSVSLDLLPLWPFFFFVG